MAHVKRFCKIRESLYLTLELHRIQTKNRPKYFIVPLKSSVCVLFFSILKFQFHSPIFSIDLSRVVEAMLFRGSKWTLDPDS